MATTIKRNRPRRMGVLSQPCMKPANHPHRPCPMPPRCL